MNELIKTISTIEIAEMMGMKHYKILEKLEGTKDKKTKGIIPVLYKYKMDINKFFVKSHYVDVKGQRRPCYIVNINGVKLILDSTRNYPQKKILYEWYLSNTSHGDNINIILCDREENIFIDKLKNALHAFNITGIKQYPILSYRIDFYLEDLNIAIEYDEGNHAYYTYDQQEKRQYDIENKLNCRFIRVGNNETDEFNIGKIIKEIFNISLEIGVA